MEAHSGHNQGPLRQGSCKSTEFICYNYTATLQDLMKPKFGSQAILLSQMDRKPLAVHVSKAHPCFRIGFYSETFVVLAACRLGKLLNPLHSRYDLEVSVHRAPNVDL